MLANQLANSLQPLCYEHHTGMRLVPIVAGNGGNPAQEPKYACQESDCLVRFTTTEGYFVALSRDRSGRRRDTPARPVSARWGADVRRRSPSQGEELPPVEMSPVQRDLHKRPTTLGSNVARSGSSTQRNKTSNSLAASEWILAPSLRRL